MGKLKEKAEKFFRFMSHNALAVTIIGGVVAGLILYGITEYHKGRPERDTEKADKLLDKGEE